MSISVGISPPSSSLSISLISLSPMTSIEGETGAQEGGEGSIGDEGKK
jgi:hypothetical protein